MTLQLGGGGAITGCTLLQEPDLIVSGITVNGDLNAPKVLIGPGTEAAPSYTFSGDTDTGLYYAGTNSIGVSTAGTNAILIDSSGNFGIGTTSPKRLLHLNGGSETVKLQITNTSTGSGNDGDGFQIGIATDGTANIEQRENADLTFATNNTERLRIDSSGNVGIGTSSPSTPLHIKGAADCYLTLQAGATDGNNGILFQNSAGTQKGVIFFDTDNDYMFFSTSNTERLRIDSSGNLNLTGSTDQRIRLNTSGAGGNDSVNIRGDGNALKYNSALGTTGVHIFETGGTERMRITSTGLVGIGTSTPVDENAFGNSLNINGPQGASFVAKNNNSSTNCGQFGYFSNQAYMINKAAGPCLFYTTNTEHAQVSATGYIHASPQGATTYYGKFNPEFHSFNQGGVAQWIAGFRSTHVTPYGVIISFSGASPNNTTQQFIYAADSTSLKFGVKSNGGIENFSGNNSNLCDEREKKNIVSLETKWDKVKNWELKKFHYNEDADTDDLRYGVIAQEVETENPELITDFTKQRAEDAVLDEDGSVVTPAKEEILRKGVKEQQMMWMAIKALQEAMAKIETLETKVAALEAG